MKQRQKGMNQEADSHRWRTTVQLGSPRPGHAHVCLTRKPDLRPPREHLILVGGPSNTFNGYCYLSQGKEWRPQSAPTSLGDVDRYIGKSGKDHHFRYPKPITHDLFWGNFCFPALNLVDPNLSLDPRPKPRQGDLITIMVYWDAYIARQSIDWEASPYSGNFAETYLDNKPGQRNALDTFDPSGLPALSHRAASSIVVSDNRINHEILMKTRKIGAAPVKGFVRIPDRPEHYTDLVRDIPRRIVLGPDMMGESPLSGVLVKVCFLRQKDDFITYLVTGKWNGPRLPHPMSTVSGVDGKLPTEQAVSIYDAGFDVCSVAKPKQAEEFWRATPNVDRRRVKISRFDYFGHSNAQVLALAYGLTNQKGAIPSPSCVITTEEIVQAIRGKKVFAREAFAQLWGCGLGQYMAPALAKAAGLRVRACQGRTDFSKVLDLSRGGLPEPSEGAMWEDFL